MDRGRPGSRYRASPVYTALLGVVDACRLCCYGRACVSRVPGQTALVEWRNGVCVALHASKFYIVVQRLLLFPSRRKGIASSCILVGGYFAFKTSIPPLLLLLPNRPTHHILTPRSSTLLPSYCTITTGVHWAYIPLFLFSLHHGPGSTFVAYGKLREPGHLPFPMQNGWTTFRNVLCHRYGFSLRRSRLDFGPLGC